MAVETLAQVGGQAMVYGAAVGVVGIHVAEGDAAGVGEAIPRSGIAFRIESGKSSDQGLRLSDTSTLSSQLETGGNGGIQTAGAEEIQQGGIHVRDWVAREIASADGEWAGGNRSAR